MITNNLDNYCMANPWVNIFLISIKNQLTQNRYRYKLNRLFEYIFQEKQFLPEEVDFLNFTEIYFKNFKLLGPIEVGFISNFLDYRYQQGDTLRSRYDTIIL